MKNNFINTFGEINMAEAELKQRLTVVERRRNNLTGFENFHLQNGSRNQENLALTAFLCCKSL